MAGLLSGLFDRVRTFNNIIVHPTQELPVPSADHYRGGPEWPDFERQLLVRHCWGAIPTAVDWPPYPAARDWPYFDRERYLNPRFRVRPRGWRSLPVVRRRQTGASGVPAWIDTVDTGIWCGPVIDHFGHLIADFGMRTAASARLDPQTTPLVFGMWPQPNVAPPPVFWQILDHLGVDRGRVLLVRRPLRFGRLSVIPQAERPYGGRTSRRHLRFMDEITAASAPEADSVRNSWVFISRSGLRRGIFAAESYLDEALAAAGVAIFHPEAEADLHAQLRLYRQARGLIFSEGSALQALQLLGHIDADVVILPRRPGPLLDNIAALRPLRARARSVRILSVMRGIICGLLDTGEPQPSRGITVFDEPSLIAGFASLGINLARLWDPQAYARRSDSDIAAWTEARLAAAHPAERAFIDKQLRGLSPSIQ